MKTTARDHRPRGNRGVEPQPNPMGCCCLAMVALAVLWLGCQQVSAGSPITVDTTTSGFDQHDGLTTLDEAVTLAGGDDHIVFAPDLSGTIVVARNAETDSIARSSLMSRRTTL